MTNIIYIPDCTWTDLDQEPIFQKFMKEYIDLLQNNLKKVEVKGHSYNAFFYYKLLLLFQIITNPKFDANVTL